MARTATRTANVFTRVDPETKEQAEAILNQLGIPMSNAIGMFLKQIVMQRGIPFDMKIPASQPLAIGSMTKEQFDLELQKGMDDIAAGRVISADAVEAEMRSLYGEG
ncbi:MAG: type II toxin-antitoxin system RelB/DinJ family antitoxin [Oscillospiraceae bacterium]|nr:type II toxin-antitoxin system RelB/DinJ family antitoxin [Oscillospiraceae bacterium]